MRLDGRGIVPKHGHTSMDVQAAKTGLYQLWSEIPMINGCFPYLDGIIHKPKVGRLSDLKLVKGHNLITAIYDINWNLQPSWRHVMDIFHC